MGNITFDENEYAVDEDCLVHQAGNQFQISIKKSMAKKLNLKERDILKVYAKIVGHEEKKKREIKNKWKKKESEPKVEDKTEEIGDLEESERDFVDRYRAADKEYKKIEFEMEGRKQFGEIRLKELIQIAKKKDL